MLRVYRFSLVGDLGHVPSDRVSCVLGGLDPPVRKGYHEGSLDLAIGILRFCLGKVGLAHVILDTVLVSVGLPRGCWRRETQGTGEEAQY